MTTRHTIYVELSDVSSHIYACVFSRIPKGIIFINSTYFVILLYLFYEWFFFSRSLYEIIRCTYSKMYTYYNKNLWTLYCIRTIYYLVRHDIIILFSLSTTRKSELGKSTRKLKWLPNKRIIIMFWGENMK